MRGIIADAVFSGNKNSLSLSGGIDPFRLRQYLLYWDKIDYPSNNMLYIGLTPEEEYLKEIGILERTHVKFYSNSAIMINPEIMIKSQLCALENNNKRKDEIWSMGQNVSELVLPQNESIKIDTVQLELLECLPVPLENTPFDDILKFKERRNDELMDFRKLMDNMYDEIINSECQELKKKRCIEELQNRIVDINRLMKESRIKRALSSMNVQLNISDLLDTATKAAIGYAGGEKIGFPELGAALGFFSSTIKITRNISARAKVLPEHLKDYAYLFYAKKEIL